MRQSSRGISCQSCGSPNRVGANFCKMCGQSLSVAPDEDDSVDEWQEQEVEQPSTEGFTLEQYAALLAAMWPLVVVYLKSKQDKGEPISVMDIAVKVGIPTAMVPLLMPVLQERLKKFLSEQGNSIFR